jgi:hypothetical protein
MTERLKRNLSTLQKLLKLRPHQRTNFIKHSSDDFMKTVCECAINSLNSTVPLNNKQLDKLKPYKRTVRILADRKISLNKKRRKILKQSGGFLLALLKPVLTAVVANLITLL